MNEKVNPALAAALAGVGGDGQLSCAEAEGIAVRLELPPAEVGAAMDALGLKIVKCQLGLFGFGTSQPHGGVVRAMPSVPAELERAIRAALVEGRLPCRAAWALADRAGVGRIEIGEACEALGIKVKPCQLGAF
jgi:hypothetical protein